MGYGNSVECNISRTARFSGSLIFLKKVRERALAARLDGLATAKLPISLNRRKNCPVSGVPVPQNSGQHRRPSLA